MTWPCPSTRVYIRNHMRLGTTILSPTRLHLDPTWLTTHQHLFQLYEDAPFFFFFSCLSKNLYEKCKLQTFSINFFLIIIHLRHSKTCMVNLSFYKIDCTIFLFFIYFLTYNTKQRNKRVKRYRLVALKFISHFHLIPRKPPKGNYVCTYYSLTEGRN